MSNSRPHKNQTLVRRYAATHDRCACCGSRRNLHTHHIIYGATRYDYASNLIRLCATHHRLCHEDKPAWTVVCLAWKSQHGELDWGELDICSGKNTAGWLETLPLDGLAARMRDRLVEHARERV